MNANFRTGRRYFVMTEKQQLERYELFHYDTFRIEFIQVDQLRLVYTWLVRIAYMSVSLATTMANLYIIDQVVTG
jgi:hypothetical protein